MITRFPNFRIGSVLAALVLAGTIGGCASGPAFLGGTSRKITLNNVSDTALNVSVFVWTDPQMQGGDATGEETGESGAFVCDKAFQLARGETGKYNLSRAAIMNAAGNPVVHIKVQPVSPSWQPAAAEYWLELLTDPPVSIVATGPAGALTFNAGEGQIALIPQGELDSGRFEHRIVTVTETEQ
jgi:hypothetical protein